MSQIFHCAKNRLRLHDHPLPSAKWRVIDDVMLARRPIAKVMNVQVNDALLLRALHHAFA